MSTEPSQAALNPSSFSRATESILPETARKRQRRGGRSLSAALRQVPGAKGGEKARFFVHSESLRDRGLDPRSVMVQFKVIPGSEMAEIVAGCQKVLLF